LGSCLPAHSCEAHFPACVPDWRSTRHRTIPLNRPRYCDRKPLPDRIRGTRGPGCVAICLSLLPESRNWPPESSGPYGSPGWPEQWVGSGGSHDARIEAAGSKRIRSASRIALQTTSLTREPRSTPRIPVNGIRRR
jgi:hypothetical protein